MKLLKISLLLLSFIALFFGHSPLVYAQGMMGQFTSPYPSEPSSVSSTTKDEADGKVIYELLQSKQKSCKDLSDDDFDVLGDYFMGQRVGNTQTHDSMNTMMRNLMGEDGEKLMHISLGKRLSGCIADAPLPAQGANFLPMMGLGGMMNGGIDNWGDRSSMMGFGSSGSLLESVILILVVIFLVLGIIYFWKEINRKKK